MKCLRSKKTISLAVIALLCVAMLSACSKTKVTPVDEVATAYYDLVIKGDTQGLIKAYGTTESETQELLDAQLNTSIQQIKTNLSAGGLTITDEQAKSMVDAQRAAFKKLTMSTEVTEEKADKATVKITTNYYDISSLDDQAATEAQEATEAMGLEEPEEYNTALVENYVAKFIEILGNAEPSTETKDVSVDFTKGKSEVGEKTKVIWAPSNPTQFGSDLVNAISQQ